MCNVFTWATLDDTSFLPTNHTNCTSLSLPITKACKHAICLNLSQADLQTHNYFKQLAFCDGTFFPYDKVNKFSQESKPRKFSTMRRTFLGCNFNKCIIKWFFSFNFSKVTQQTAYVSHLGIWQAAFTSMVERFQNSQQEGIQLHCTLPVK